MSQSDYLRYRGKCKEFCERAIAQDKTLTLVRGYYNCPIDGKQQHWWCIRADNTVYDPTVAQFATKGVAATYEPFDGRFFCEQCGKEIPGVTELTVLNTGRYPVCSVTCGKRLVGIS